MTLMVLAQLTLVHRETPWILLGSLLLTLMELGIVTAFVIFFSSFTTPGLTAFFTISVIVTGSFAEQILYFGGQGESPMVAVLTGAFYWALPHLSTFNVRGMVTHGIAVPPERMAFAVTYALLYMGAVLTVAGAIFERRDFR